MRTCCKRGYLGGSVIEKKSRLVGLEFAHVKCMYVFAFHNAQRIPVIKLPGTSEENWTTSKFIEGFLSLRIIGL